MSIRIKNISLKNLGPLDTLDLDLGSLNLVYGRNESGKTYLVEFLLGALFRQATAWNLRELPGRGQISVEGLNKSSLKFSLKTKKKIEDYWDERDEGLPLNMSRLLVVKGGELDLADTPGGVNRSVLKAALTNEFLLDQLRLSIPKTVQGANIFNNEIMGAKRGILKDREDLRSELDQLQGLLNRVEEEYSRGPLREIELEMERVKAKLEDQERAKQSRAFHLRQEMKGMHQELRKYSDQVLADLRDDLHDLKNGEKTLLELKESLAAHQDVSQEYSWLESAISIWEKLNLEGTKAPPRWIAYAGMSGLLVGVIALGINDLIIDFDLFWAGISLTLISGGINLYYLLRLRNLVSGIHKSEERESIQNEFKARFGTSATSLSTLKEKFKSIQKSYFQVEPLEKTIREAKRNLDQYRSNIRAAFIELKDESISEEIWEETYLSIAERANQLKDSIHELDMELQSLAVPEEFINDHQLDQVYDPLLSQDLSRSLDDLIEKSGDYQNRLNSLKQLICHETGDDISTSWGDALYHLRSAFNEKSDQYRSLTTRLAAEIGVTQILDLIEQEEDQRIQNEINSPEVTTLINELTGRYHSLELVDDQVFIHDQYSQYPLSEISTGAREQVLLALRMGIASKISQGEPLFLILDDAFQHSDWKRREMLVRSIINLVKNSWQVIYLTMDDHLRDLITRHGKKEFGQEFRKHEL